MSEGLDITKRCHACKQDFPLTAFQKNNSRPDRLQTQCRACLKIHGGAWYQKHKVRLAERAAVRRQTIEFQDLLLRRSYGISYQDFLDLLEKQNHTCAVCKQACKTYSRLSVDHDHRTGQVRGLLCSDCNRALGLLRDDAERLERAIKYLKGA